MQTNSKIPEDASFRAPIKAVHNDIDFFGKKVYHVEIGISYDDYETEKKHPLSIFVSSDTEGKFDEKPVVGTPIYGTVYMQGRMRSMVYWDERPSTVLHSFDAVEKDGTPDIFVHRCPEEEIGQEMTEEERETFAKEVYYQFLFERVDLEKNESDVPGAPCFKSTRRRDIWVKADAEYNAMERFQEEDVSDGLLLYFQKHHFPVMAYITLYDSRGRECKWLKGGSYTAKIHYGSMLPGQKMDILSDYTHEELVEMLCESYNELSTGVIGGYLHKDLDFRTRSLAEPIISREEYILRTENVNEALQKSKKESVKATIVKDENGDSVIELVYLSGGIDRVHVKSESGLITAIKIDTVKE